METSDYPVLETKALTAKPKFIPTDIYGDWAREFGCTRRDVKTIAFIYFYGRGNIDLEAIKKMVKTELKSRGLINEGSLR